VHGGRGHGCKEEVAGEDHDGVRGEEGEERGAGFAEGRPGAVFEGADCGCYGGVCERGCCHCGCSMVVLVSVFLGCEVGLTIGMEDEERVTIYSISKRGRCTPQMV